MSETRSIPPDPEQRSPMEHGIVCVLKTVFDPEIPVDVYELGLIYDIRVSGDGDAAHVDVDMTLTSPMCPAAGSLPGEVKEKVESVSGVSTVNVNVIWEPPWEMSRMSDAAKLRLNVG